MAEKGHSRLLTSKFWLSSLEFIAATYTRNRSLNCWDKTLPCMPIYYIPCVLLYLSYLSSKLINSEFRLRTSEFFVPSSDLWSWLPNFIFRFLSFDFGLLNSNVLPNCNFLANASKMSLTLIVIFMQLTVLVDCVLPPYTPALRQIHNGDLDLQDFFLIYSTDEIFGFLVNVGWND